MSLKLRCQPPARWVVVILTKTTEVRNPVLGRSSDVGPVHFYAILILPNFGIVAKIIATFSLLPNFDKVFFYIKVNRPVVSQRHAYMSPIFN